VRGWSVRQESGVSERATARAAKRRRRLWFNVASWATTLLIVLLVGLIVRWRVSSVLEEDRRQKQAEAELGQALRGPRETPADVERAAARLRALIAAWPGTECARKALAELEKLEAAKGSPRKGR
jgi:hypothetical protein